MNTNQKVWLSCSARWTVIRKTVAETIVLCEIMKWKQENYEHRVTESEKNTSHALCEADKEFLWSLGQLVKHSAQALVNVNFKNVTEHLIWPSWETRVLPLKEDLPKRGKEGYGIAKRAVKPRMFTTRGKKCPVMLLEKMLSRRLPELKNCGPFYLKTISKPKGQVWFSRQQLGEHKVGKTMKDTAVKSGLIAATAKKITNHLSRKTSVQKL